MTAYDALRWNKRYTENIKKWESPPRALLADNLDLLPRNGLALDIAMGFGQNSSLLLSRGLDVIGIDISSVAVRIAKQNIPELMAVIADLSEFKLCEVRFDAIVNFYYLQRSIIPDLYSSLKPGGLLFLETLTEPILSIKPDIEPSQLLKNGELIELLKGWEILYYAEGWSDTSRTRKKSVASVIARKPVEKNEIE